MRRRLSERWVQAGPRLWRWVFVPLHVASLLTLDLLGRLSASALDLVLYEGVIEQRRSAVRLGIPR